MKYKMPLYISDYIHLGTNIPDCIDFNKTLIQHFCQIDVDLMLIQHKTL